MISDPASVQKMRVKDAADSAAQQDIEIHIESHGVAIRPVGYGHKHSFDGQGSPVLIEFRNGIPVLIVWDDINNEDPSHIISLQGAAESNRDNEAHKTDLQ